MTVCLGTTRADVDMMTTSTKMSVPAAPARPSPAKYSV